MKKQQRGFTLVELLVVIVIIAVLAAIGVTATSKLRDRAKLVKSNNNLRQNWTMVLMYASDHGGRLPANTGFNTGTWQHRLTAWSESLTPGQTTQLFQGNDTSRAGILEIFKSPLDDSNGNMSWGSLGWPGNQSTEVFGYGAGRPLAMIDNPATSVALAPFFKNKTLIGGNWQQPSTPANISYNEDNKAYCVFVDGHISALTRDELENGQLIWSYPRMD